MKIFNLLLGFIKPILLILVLAIVAIFLLSIWNSANRSPEATTNSFVSLTQNPTNRISNNEKRVISKITETNFLKNFQYESLIREIRAINKQYPNPEIQIENNDDNPYSIGSIIYTDSQGEEQYNIKLFMETYSRYPILPKQTKIFHIEIEGDQGIIDNETINDLKKNIDRVRDRIEGGFDSLINDRLKLNLD